MRLGCFNDSSESGLLMASISLLPRERVLEDVSHLVSVDGFLEELYICAVRF